MKISRRVKTGCALALAGLLALPCVNLMQTKAAVAIEEKECTLTIEADKGLFDADEYLEEKEIPVELYKVADVDASGTFTTTEPFAGIDFNVSMNQETNAETWSSRAEQAVEKLKANSAIEPAEKVAITKKDPAVEIKLNVGMYLVVSEDTFNDNNSVKYVFTPYLTALPSSEYTLTGEGSDDWEYVRTITLKGEAEPQFGSLTINKTLSSYNETLGPMSCVFQVEWTEGGKLKSDVVSLTLDKVGHYSVTVENIPVGVEVKVKEIYSGASYTVSNREDKATIVLGEGEEGASVSFENSYDGGNQGGYGVTNHFEQEDGVWEWENPAPPKTPVSE